MFFELIATAHAAGIAGAGKTAGNAPQKTTQATASGGTDFVDILMNVLSVIFNVVLLLILLFLLLKLIRVMYEIYNARRLVYMRVTLPRADSKLDKEKETKKDFKEKMGIMSIFYKSIHKVSNITFWDSLKDFIFDHAKVSLELIYSDGQLSFYIVTYRDYASLITQQITSNYPDAEVCIIKASQFPDIKPAGFTLRAASIGKVNDDIFPLKTYKYFEDDPLSTLTNNFGSLKKTDKAAFQIVVKPRGSSWNKKAKNAAGMVAKGQYKKGSKDSFVWEAIKMLFAPIVWIFDMFTNTPGDGSTAAPGAASGDSYKIFNQAEQESHKAVGESAGQPGYQASLRLLVSSDDSMSAKNALESLVGAMSMFTDEYNNKLDNPQIEDALAFFFAPIRYFAYRFRMIGFLQAKSVFSVDELSTIYHFPDINYNKSPILKWLEYKMIAPPHNLKVLKDKLVLSDYRRDATGNVLTEDPTVVLAVDENKILKRDEGRNFVSTTGEIVPIHQDGPDKGKAIDPTKNPIAEEKHRHLGGFPLYTDGVLMGWNEYRNTKTPIYFSRKDRGRHHYVIGKSGGGKSVFLSYLARQDLWNGDGLCVIDPHGDLVEDIIAYAPKERAKDIIIFNPADYERPMGLNMLEVISTDPALRAVEKDRAALDATSIFIKIFNEEVFGPRIQHYFRNGCLTLMDDEDEGGTLIDVPRLFVDDAFMKYKVSKVKNPVVKAFWEHEYANTGDREKQEMIPYFSSKFGPFITNTTIRNIIGQPKSAFNLRSVMDDRKVLMVNLSKGMIGDLNAQLLGLIFVSKINMAAMSRADIPEDQRKDFFLYVDEFQNFATDTFGEILSEARKYHLALIMAHQYIAQIGSAKGKSDKPSIKDAVFGNAGTIMSFKVGAEDAEYLEKEYAPLLSQQDIIGIANYTTYCKLNIDNATTRPFDMKTIWDNSYKNPEVAKIIKEYSRKMYGRKKEYVDMEIEARLGIMPS